MVTMNAPLLDWGVASRALPGEAESGDHHLVKLFPSGALAAVVDGLGHGDEAASAAKAALKTLESYAQDPGISLLKRCHESIRATRGAVMSLATFSAIEGTMTWLGVGNVEGLLIRSDAEVRPRYESLLVRRGVVGSRLPPLYATALPVMRGDTLVFVTDGIRSGFERGLTLTEPPQQIPKGILARHILGTDDALVLVVRYIGNTHEGRAV
jgi:negative regulator of sigma-B (phosphoserine phosphatase)